jgi:spore maturation protein CgeB
MKKDIDVYKQMLFKITAEKTKLSAKNKQLEKEYALLEKKNIILKNQNHAILNSKSYKFCFPRLLRELYNKYWHKNMSMHTTTKQTPSMESLIKNHSFTEEEKSLPKDLKSINTIKELKIATILDEFSFALFEPEAQLVQLTPKHWQQEIEALAPDILMVESAWRGRDNLWTNKIVNPSQELIHIVGYCREHGIATVFWNKEDPFHFEDYIFTASYFDFVFTTDIDCIPLYKSRLGHGNVFLLPFAAQPTIHNPIEVYARKDAFVFAGAYYHNFPDRSAIFENFIEYLIPFGEIDIFDRNFDNPNPALQYPQEYKPYIRGRLPYDEITKAYKGYRYAINMTSVTHSKTMFARRVFELMASNTLVISNKSEGIKAFFGELMILADSGEELIRQIEKVIHEPLFKKKLQLMALRKVLSQHTAEDRLSFLVSKVFKRPIKSRLPQISIIAIANNAKEANSIYSAYRSQTYLQKKLILVCSSNFDISRLSLPNTQIFQEHNDRLISEVCKASKYICALYPDDYYAENYLADLVLASRYCSASVIGKKSYYIAADGDLPILQNKGKSYHFVRKLSARCSIILSQVVADQSLCDWANSLESLEYSTQSVFSIDEFNYCKEGLRYSLSMEALEQVSDLKNIDIGLDIGIIEEGMFDG